MIPKTVPYNHVANKIASAYRCTVYEHLGCVNIYAHTFFVCGPKFTTSPEKLR